MTKFLVIALGGAIGSVVRFFFSERMNAMNMGNFPYAIMVVNITGCFMMGLAAGIFAKYNLPYEWKVFVTVGIMGGYTTFSAFSLDAMMLLEKGEFLNAALYICGSVFLSLLGFAIGNNILRFV